MAHAEKCPVCGGSGKLAASITSTDVSEKICHGCLGAGWVTVPEPHELFGRITDPPYNITCGAADEADSIANPSIGDKYLMGDGVNHATYKGHGIWAQTSVFVDPKIVNVPQSWVKIEETK